MDKLEAAHQQYVLEVRSNTLVYTVDPATLPGRSPGPKWRRKLGSYRYPEIRSAREIVKDLPAEASTFPLFPFLKGVTVFHDGPNSVKVVTPPS